MGIQGATMVLRSIILVLLAAQVAVGRRGRTFVSPEISTAMVVDGSSNRAGNDELDYADELGELGSAPPQVKLYTGEKCEGTPDETFPLPNAVSGDINSGWEQSGLSNSGTSEVYLKRSTTGHVCSATRCIPKTYGSGTMKGLPRCHYTSQPTPDYTLDPHNKKAKRYCCPVDESKRVFEKIRVIADAGKCFVKCDAAMFKKAFKSWECHKFWEAYGCETKPLGCSTIKDCVGVCIGRSKKERANDESKCT